VTFDTIWIKFNDESPRGPLLSPHHVFDFGQLISGKSVRPWHKVGGVVNQVEVEGAVGIRIPHE
jgi:hypothetical protein